MSMQLWQRPLVSLGGMSVTPLGLLTFGASIVVVFIAAFVMSRVLARLLERIALVQQSERYAITRIVYYAILLFGVLVSLESLGVTVSKTFVTLGGTGISLFSLTTFGVLAASVLVGSHIAGRWVDQHALNRTQFDEGLRYAIGRITYYAFLALGMMIALQTVGIQLGSLTVLLGALGVGIGFGLQNIVNNFVSGLILLVERPIKVGDWVDLDGVTGRVSNIGARSTTVVTNDEITIIIPNGDCLANQMINWSYGNSRIRLRIPVGVAYGSDMAKVKELLLEAAGEQKMVLSDPPPHVIFDAFGDSSLNLQLGVWIMAGSVGAQALRSNLNFAIDEKFRQAGVEIPFPQRDLHLRTPGEVWTPRISL